MQPSLEGMQRQQSGVKFLHAYTINVSLHLIRPCLALFGLVWPRLAFSAMFDLAWRRSDMIGLI